MDIIQSFFQTVYNVLSFALASMLFTSLFLLVSQGRVLPRYRQAIVVWLTDYLQRYAVPGRNARWKMNNATTTIG